ncbi:hypothetical protein [uncultured Duncaniella sp.]|uniref:hypothetical protein n=1 Tax=uncultured Duncaniella sp. TaxID=2768039 RepID=UPI0025FA04E0|nr:hypothetical protein [uncultured Duncaniella sp.]
MRNIDFIQLHAKWNTLSKKVQKIQNPNYEHKWDIEYFYQGYNVQGAYLVIVDLYKLAKEEGLTEEQRQLFFQIIKKHNEFTRGSLAAISDKISQLKVKDEYFDESELGAYAGYYSLGFNENESEIENLDRLYDNFKGCFFSLKGEHIKADGFPRISMRQTMDKWNEVKNYVYDDTISPYTTAYPPKDLP